MKAQTVLQTRQMGRKLVISLKCGHVVHLAIGYWGTEVPRKIDCPQCGGYRK